MRRSAALGPRRAAPGRGVRRRAARRGNGTRHALFAEFRQRPETTDRRPRCPDARDGAAAHVSRTRFVRRPGSGAGAAAAAQRLALGARQPLAVRGHAAVAEPEIRSERRAAVPDAGRTIDFGGAMGAAPPAAFPNRLARLHPRRTHRAESGNSGESHRKAGAGCNHAAGVPAVVGRGRHLGSGARQRIGRQRDVEALARSGRPADQGAI